MRGADTMITDCCLWTTQQADALRNMRWGDVDMEAVAEEIEDMGKKDKRALESHLVVGWSICSRGVISPTGRNYLDAFQYIAL